MIQSARAITYRGGGNLQWFGRRRVLPQLQTDAPKRPLMMCHKKRLTRHFGGDTPLIQPRRCSLIITPKLISINRLSPVTAKIGEPYYNMIGSSHFAAVRIYSSSSQRPPNQPRGGGRFRSSLGMITAGGALLLGKGKYIFGALKLTKVREYFLFATYYILYVLNDINNITS